jgi:hypothetical protein
MNFFGKIFGESKATDVKKAEQQQVGNANIIGKLREQVELLEKRNIFIERKKNTLVAEAKQKLTSGDKKGALLILNQKKKVEAEIEKNQGSQLLLENQLSALECATINKEVITSLMVGNKAMKQINKDLSPEKIDELMDDIQEETDNYKAIQDAMTQPLQQIYNDDELLAELEDLGNEDNEEKELQKLLQVDVVGLLEESISFPAVPKKELPTRVKREETDIELELKELEQSMLLA